MEGYKTLPTPPITGPRSIGQIAAIAKGTYTEIVKIEAPTSAAVGEFVPVIVTVKNLHSDSLYIGVTGLCNADELYSYPEYYLVGPGGIYPFAMSFTMPNHGVRVWAFSHYWTGTDWYQDDEGYVDIALAEVYAGTIIGIELEHDGVQEGLPVYNIPQGQTARVHVWGRNDMATVQRLGIGWIVTGPGGPDDIVERHEDDWSFLGYRQGADHKFSGGYFNLNKPGTYTINIALYMNPADPEIVDDYSGTLCTVAAVVPEPEFRGFGVTKYVTV